MDIGGGVMDYFWLSLYIGAGFTVGALIIANIVLMCSDVIRAIARVRRMKKLRAFVAKLDTKEQAK